MSQPTDPSISTITTMREELEALHEAATERLRQAEAVASRIPQLRSELRILERSLRSLDSSVTPRRANRSGPTIRDSILTVLAEAGGSISFGVGKMLTTVHDLVGGNRNSVQVEIHRLRKSGQIEVVRDADRRPVGIRLAPTLKAIAGGGEGSEARQPDEEALLEG